MTEYITAAEAARRLGVTRWQVFAWIRSGRLPAGRFGRDYQIDAAHLEPLRQRPGRGRPRKERPANE
jgi:excisionase family DNA binding protein